MNCHLNPESKVTDEPNQPPVDPLESIETTVAATSRATPDAAGAIEALADPPDLDDDDEDDDPAPARPKKRGKKGRKGGWPKGKKRTPSKGATSKPASSKGKAPTKAQIQEQLDAALERLSAYEEGREPVDPIAAASKALAGALLTGSSMLEGPYREMQLTEAEAKELGDIWAPVLEPHWGTVVEKAPAAVAAFMTARILYPKWKRMQDPQILPANPDGSFKLDRSAEDEFVRPRGAAGEGASDGE